jgi:hypothetical protein
MDVSERLKLERRCGIDGCDGLALILSEPPRCYGHIENADAWFETVLSETVAPDVPRAAREMATHMAHDLYRNVLLNNPLGQELYADYRNRVALRKMVAFSFADVVYFGLIAAASGIIGNFAYDVVKSIVRNLAEKHRAPKLAESYERVVRETRYEELRIEYHSGDSCNLQSTTELEREIETRYRLVVWEETNGD